MFKADYRLEYGEEKQVLAESGALPRYKARCVFQSVLGGIGAGIFIDSICNDPGYIMNYVFLAMCIILAFFGWIKAYFDTERIINENLPDEQTEAEIYEDKIVLTTAKETVIIPLNGSYYYSCPDEIMVIYLNYGEKHVIPLRAFGENACRARQIIENGCRKRKQ